MCASHIAHCNTLQHTRTHCNTLQHCATHCITLQHTAAHCSTLQHTATHTPSDYSTHSFSRIFCVLSHTPQNGRENNSLIFPLQHTAHCTTLRHTATHCNTLQHTATHCNTLHHTATHCNTLQHTTTNCNTLQHTASLILPLSRWCILSHNPKKRKKRKNQRLLQTLCVMLTENTF